MQEVREGGEALVSRLEGFVGGEVFVVFWVWQSNSVGFCEAEEQGGR